MVCVSDKVVIKWSSTSGHEATPSTTSLSQSDTSDDQYHPAGSGGISTSLAVCQNFDPDFDFWLDVISRLVSGGIRL